MIICDSRQVWEVHFYHEKDKKIFSNEHPMEKKDDAEPISRFWSRRHEYWPNFDDGIVTDKTGLFSVTPWDSAVSISNICDEFYPKDSDIIVDACCGVGGNTNAFATVVKSSIVIGVDNDLRRVSCARHNSFICKSSSRTEFVRADAFSFLSSLRHSVRFVFCSPPWGGIGYNIESYSDLPFDIQKLVDSVKAACVNGDLRLALFMPRNFNVEEAKKIAPKRTVVGSCKVQSGNRHIANLFLYGKPSTEKRYYFL